MAWSTRYARCDDRRTTRRVHDRARVAAALEPALDVAHDERVPAPARLYHQARIGQYWIVDPRDTTLTGTRWADPGYLAVLRAERGETVRPEPFAEIAIAVGTLFGDDAE